jgi:GT2 family glycosyltransferase
MEAESPRLSVVTVNWNTRDLLHNCLASIASDPGLSLQAQRSANDGQRVEIIVVDNASADGSAEMVRAEYPEVELIVNAQNVGFARANNQGIRASQGQYIVLLNSDTVVPSGALAALAAFLEAHPEAGAIGPRLVWSDGTPQPYAFGGDPTLAYLARRGLNRILFHRYLHDWSTGAPRKVDWVAGTCLMIRREVLDRAGLLDERIFLYFEDNDWCLRMREAGWQVYYNPQVEIVHLGGQSAAKNPAARRAYYDSLQYFYRKHYGPLALGVLRLCLPFYRLALRP